MAAMLDQSIPVLNVIIVIIQPPELRYKWILNKLRTWSNYLICRLATLNHKNKSAITIAHQTRTETKINSGSETDSNSNIFLVVSRGGDPPEAINTTTVGQFWLPSFFFWSAFLQFYLHRATQNERKFRLHLRCIKWNVQNRGRIFIRKDKGI